MVTIAQPNLTRGITLGITFDEITATLRVRLLLNHTTTPPAASRFSYGTTLTWPATMRHHDDIVAHHAPLKIVGLV